MEVRVEVDASLRNIWENAAYTQVHALVDLPNSAVESIRSISGNPTFSTRASSITMYCHVLPCITMYYHVLPCITMYCHVLPCITMYYHVLPCITMYYHVLPCITMYYHVLPCITMYDSIFFTSQSFILASSFEVTSPSSWLARHDYLFFTWIGVGGRICDQLRRLPGYSVRSGRWKGGTRLAAMVNPLLQPPAASSYFFLWMLYRSPLTWNHTEDLFDDSKFLTRYPVTPVYHCLVFTFPDFNGILPHSLPNFQTHPNPLLVFHPSCWSLNRHVWWSNPTEKLWHYHILRSNHPLTSYFRVPSGNRAFDPPEKSTGFLQAGATLRGRVELAAESSGCHEALWSSRGSSGEKIPRWFLDDWTDKMLDFLSAIKF